MLNSLNEYLKSQGCTEPLNMREEVEFDVETYPNYFLIAFLFKGKHVVSFEIRNNQPFTQLQELVFVCQNFTLVGFNSNYYDVPMLLHFASGSATNNTLYALSYDLIEKEVAWWKIKDSYKHSNFKFDHYDIINVAPDPAKVSLKMYSARRLASQLQDLPFDPHTPLTDSQIETLRAYCVKDIVNTHGLKNDLHTEIEMRKFMSQQYNMDLRSKSDAQIGEAVALKLVEARLGRAVPKPINYKGKVLRYTVPTYIKFETPLMQNVCNVVANAEYPVSKESGKPEIPDVVSELKIKIGNTEYTLGIGGLHSKEKEQTIICGKRDRLRDVDADSFYPFLIINNQYCPKTMGAVFLQVYQEDLVNPRIKHKRASANMDLTEAVRKEEKKLANSKKIVINGLYGKLGDPYSKMYAPELMISVCLTGQLSLLMLIERMELQGISAVSANTDGVVLKYTDDQTELVDAIIKQWEKDCNFTTEETFYHALYSANVNNYIAIKSDKDCQIIKGAKRKGIFSDHWITDQNNFKLRSTPNFLICRNAVVNYLTERKPIEQTIRECTDIKQFLSVRAVKGGGVFRGEKFGRIARFYISNVSQDCLQYAKNGNKVANSDNAELMLNTTDGIPGDLDYDFYIPYADEMLYDIGYKVRNRMNVLF